MTDVIFEENLETLAEELGLEHEDYERLASYVSLVRTYPIPDGDTSDYVRENLTKWIEQEQEAYFGTFNTPEDFTRDYIENYVEYNTPNWVVIDYEQTWNSNLRHDFHFEAFGYGDSGYVWSEIY